MDQIFGMGRYKKWLNLTKIVRATMGVFPKRALQKSNFLTF